MQPAGILESDKATNPPRSLEDYGQSVWLDYIRRSLISSGELKRLIEEDGLKGITSNPSIFEKAITGSTDCADLLESLGSKSDLDAKSRYEALAIRDIQSAADILHSVYQRTRRRDGYVSLEVSPYLARDTQGTVAEARRLWKAVGRENVMIKVPATGEGVHAFLQLVSEGINVNVTLLFSQAVYEQVAEAYITGLEGFAARGGDVSRIASVASFFISRIDSAVDGIVTERLKGVTDECERKRHGNAERAEASTSPGWGGTISGQALLPHHEQVLCRQERDTVLSSRS
jgi:transaldolase/glucose-6-phosphate isomerase